MDFYQAKPRGQTDTDNPAEYGFIRKWIVPLGIKRKAFQNIRFHLTQTRIPFSAIRFHLIQNWILIQIIRLKQIIKLIFRVVHSGNIGGNTDIRKQTPQNQILSGVCFLTRIARMHRERDFLCQENEKFYQWGLAQGILRLPTELEF